MNFLISMLLLPILTVLCAAVDRKAVFTRTAVTLVSWFQVVLLSILLAPPPPPRFNRLPKKVWFSQMIST